MSVSKVRRFLGVIQTWKIFAFDQQMKDFGACCPFLKEGLAILSHALSFSLDEISSNLPENGRLCRIQQFIVTHPAKRFQASR